MFPSYVKKCQAELVVRLMAFEACTALEGTRREDRSRGHNLDETYPM